MPNDTRIESLETQVQTLKRMLFGVLGLAVVGGLLAATSMQSVPDVIQAKKFEVVNGEGKVVVSMFSILDQGTHYGFVTTANSKGGRLVELSANRDGNGLVRTENGKGQTLVTLNSTTKGYGLVETHNGKGGTLVKLGPGPNGGGVVGTFDKEGKELTSITP